MAEMSTGLWRKAISRYPGRYKVINKLRVRVQEEKGFTLVELLVVMLILGLLAAIAIPSFFNQRDKAKDADAKEQVRTAQTAIETYATDHDGVYDSGTIDDTDLSAIEPVLNDVGTDLTVSTPTGYAGTPTDDADNSYTVTVTSDNDSQGVDAMEFSITRHGDGTLEYTCIEDGADGCPSGGDWG
jgi:type IV pilus assembly protein PilA